MKGLFFAAIAFLIISCKPSIKTSPNIPVQIAGAMKNVMWNGELDGIIQLDTITNQDGLYGLGPLAFLKGEILLLDGKAYVSKILENGNPNVEIQHKAKAPFFVYGNVTKWEERELPENVIDLQSLERYITELYNERTSPFIIKIEAKVAAATYHIQNLADGSVVTNPQEAHAGQQSFELNNEEVVIIGFYSKNHKGIFTHHDTNMHLHIITKDKTQMGHLDELLLEDGRLFISLAIN